MIEVSASAPGRVNLIGEHTDYHEGYVLPCATPQRTQVELRTRTDRRVRASSAALPGEVEFELGGERRTAGWGDYVQGVTWALRRRGYALGGCELRVHSDVPRGSGLSSSAALEVAVLRALRAAFELPLSDLEVALCAHEAEVEFVGVPVGVMDQVAASFASEREALFLDTRTLAMEAVPLPDGLGLVVIDSGVRHEHVSGGYRERRRESEEAARRLGVTHLRDVDARELARVEALPPLLARRARHVVTENQRVLDAKRALEDDNLRELGRLFVASHASMRDDYEVSVPPVDLLVEIALAESGVFGARLTGGGFGGCVVVATLADHAAEVAGRIAEVYCARSGIEGAVLIPPGLG